MDNPTAPIGVESEWVRLCPYLQVRAPHPLIADQDRTTKDVREIYDFFKDQDPKDAVGTFLKHYNKLPQIPGVGESKIGQVLMSIRLMKMVKQAKLTEVQTKKTLEKLGISI